MAVLCTTRSGAGDVMICDVLAATRFNQDAPIVTHIHTIEKGMLAGGAA